MPLISNIFHYKSKNRILFCVLFFIISSISLTAQNFQLASNNKTITCDNASFGQTGVVGGKTYTKVNRNTLVSMISGGQDVSCVCTSGITNMQGLFQNTLQTSPKQIPPKITTQESYVKEMISMD